MLRAKAHLQSMSLDNDDNLRFETEFLKGSHFEQDVGVMANIFDKRTKHSFRNPGDKYVCDLEPCTTLTQNLASRTVSLGFVDINDLVSIGTNSICA